MAASWFSRTLKHGLIGATKFIRLKISKIACVPYISPCVQKLVGADEHDII